MCRSGWSALWRGRPSSAASTARSARPEPREPSEPVAGRRLGLCRRQALQAVHGDAGLREPFAAAQPIELEDEERLRAVRAKPAEQLRRRQDGAARHEAVIDDGDMPPGQHMALRQRDTVAELVIGGEVADDIRADRADLADIDETE